MKAQHLLLLAALTAAVLAGCNNTTSPGTTNGPSLSDQVAAVIAADPAGDPSSAGFDGNDNVLESSPSFSQVLYGRPGETLADTCWFRRVGTSNANHSATGDTTNLSITLTRTNTGVLSVGNCPNPGASPYFTKNYSVTWTRSGTYAKSPTADAVAGEEDATSITRWHLLTASLPHTVVNVGDPVIDSVSIGTVDGSLSKTYRDPTAMMDPQTWPQFAPGDSIVVKLYTGTPNVFGFVHFDLNHGSHARLQRRRMLRQNLVGPYIGEFVVRHGYFNSRPRGWRVRQAIWVDLVTRATLRDPNAAYAGSGWGVPYRLPHPAGAGFALR